ncbi:MAG: hypothetical protein AAF514_08790 [Verrucomicrobiota bacterium]
MEKGFSEIYDEMKLLTLLLCLLLLGCEKRVADPGIREVREWLLSEDGQNVATEWLLEEGSRTTLDQLAPRENWIIKRAVTQMKGEWFVLYAERKTGEGVAFVRGLEKTRRLYEK